MPDHNIRIAAHGHRQAATTAEARRRRVICTGCPHYTETTPGDHTTARCALCSCSLRIKTRTAAATCPRGWW